MSRKWPEFSEACLALMLTVTPLSFAQDKVEAPR